jgi:hypothetical protein
MDASNFVARFYAERAAVPAFRGEYEAYRRRTSPWSGLNAQLVPWPHRFRPSKFLESGADDDPAGAHDVGHNSVIR